MSTFEHVWFDRVKMLTMAVDSLISFDDFLAVSEAHISEDCQQGIQVYIIFCIIINLLSRQLLNITVKCWIEMLVIFEDVQFEFAIWC